MSIVAFFSTHDLWNDYPGITTTVTIDLDKQQVVQLNDLITINDEFIQLFKNGSITKSDESLGVFDSVGGWTDFSHWDNDELQDLVDLCSTSTTSENAQYYTTPRGNYFKSKP